jgi:steroid delta-isomerase-like uncharacterized protein
MTAKTDSSATEKTESKEERNKKVIKQGMDALNNHDFDKMTSLMTDDAVDYGDGSGHSIKGRDSINANMKTFFGSFPDFKGEDSKFYADGDNVVVTATYSGTFKKDMGKMKANGKSFKFRDADIFTLNDAGKITSHSYIQSDATMMSQLADKKK